MTTTPPYDPRAVANLLLDLADQFGIVVTHLALQKLLYFAHGHFLRENGQPLVQGGFEAWKNGPVHPAVYHAFKSAGREPITDRAVGRNVMTGMARALDLPRDPVVLRQLRRVLDAYGHLSPGLLVHISHAPKGPWDVIQKRASHSTALGSRIPDSLIKEAFRHHKVDAAIGMNTVVADDDEPVLAAGFNIIAGDASPSDRDCANPA